PVILHFTAVSDGFQCSQGIVFEVSWETEHASQAFISANGGASQAYGPSGTTSICLVGTAARQPRFLLVAVGPGGETLESIAGVYDLD
ncbi:MAG: hypothetical protein GX643_16325, partial [Acidimicrobiales bacterium]|nr:hypothetical protein [Acidimicrobiales bacterium]